MTSEAQKESMRKYYRANKEDWKRRNKTVPVSKLMLNQARARARRKGLPFDIELEDIVVPTHCPVLGVELSRGTRQDRDCSFSLDRIKPELGYVKVNVAVISQKANRMKNDATIEELNKLITWMENLNATNV